MSSKVSPDDDVEPYEMELTHDEPIIFRAQLTNNWLTYRLCSFSWKLGPFGLFLLPFYACAVDARRNERESFKLLLTATAIIYTQKTYDAGCCCQSTIVKTIPLEKIQDLNLVADCCGDCCGFAPSPGAPYKLLVQTAGGSAPDGEPELVIMCVDDIKGLRKQVFAAKRALAATAAVGGAAKPNATDSGTTKAAGGEGGASRSAEGSGHAVAHSAEEARMLATLERIERLVENGVLELRATRTSK